MGERHVKLAMTPAGKSVFRLRSVVPKEDSFAGLGAVTVA
jgi:hypothetical protein